MRPAVAFLIGALLIWLVVTGRAQAVWDAMVNAGTSSSGGSGNVPGGSTTGPAQSGSGTPNPVQPVPPGPSNPGSPGVPPVPGGGSPSAPAAVPPPGSGPLPFPSPGVPSFPSGSGTPTPTPSVPTPQPKTPANPSGLPAAAPGMPPTKPIPSTPNPNNPVSVMNEFGLPIVPYESPGQPNLPPDPGAEPFPQLVPNLAYLSDQAGSA